MSEQIQLISAIILTILGWELSKFVYSSVSDAWLIYNRRLVLARTTYGVIRIKCPRDKWQENVNEVIKTYAGDIIFVAGTRF